MTTQITIPTDAALIYRTINLKNLSPAAAAPSTVIRAAFATCAKSTSTTGLKSNKPMANISPKKTAPPPAFAPTAPVSNANNRKAATQTLRRLRQTHLHQTMFSLFPTMAQGANLMARRRNYTFQVQVTQIDLVSETQYDLRVDRMVRNKPRR